MEKIDQIANFFMKTIKPSPVFDSPDPIDDQALLFPDFIAAWKVCVAEYRLKYPSQDLTFSETYRSNSLQEKYFNQGSSKIRKDGMHHFGIAGDTIFIIDGKRSYKGDINLVRSIYKKNGLTVLGMWDALHVQYIPVADQQKLRNAVNQILN